MTVSYNMSIETKRSLMRASIEKTRLVHNNGVLVQQANQENMVETNQQEQIPVKRIKTIVKTSYLGNNLHPDYIKKYEDSSFIVAGCGTSINLYDDFSEHYVIGVNDIERILTPDFLLVVNDYRTFMRGRWQFVQESLSPVIFSHLGNPGPITRSQNLVKLKIGTRGGVPNLDRFDCVDHTMNSPYMAAIIAYQLGAKKIAIVGVDFTDNHFFEKTGNHKLTRHIKNIDAEYDVLKNELIKRGVKVANLSPISQLTSWPKMSLEEFNNL